MRKLFPGYFRPTDEEFLTWWQQGVFAFDANVLLNIYRYTPKTRQTLLEILSQLEERLWLPHQAAYEYHQNRLEVISSQMNAYAGIEKKIEESFKKLETELRTFQRHPFVDVDQVLETLKRAIKRAKSHLKQAQANHPDLLAYDDLRDELVELFDDKVGSPLPTEELEKVYKQAEQRFKQEIPPGYKDQDKKGTQKYGDVILWFQLIKFAEAGKKPLIFTTDDRKEDWWLRHDGKTISPRPELIQEMLDKAGVQFYMYSTDQFMRYAQGFLKLHDEQEAIEEVREIRRQDERSGVTASQVLAAYPSYLSGKEIQDTLTSIRRLTAQNFLPQSTLNALINLATPSISPSILKAIGDISALSLITSPTYQALIDAARRAYIPPLGFVPHVPFGEASELSADEEEDQDIAADDSEEDNPPDQQQSDEEEPK